MASNVSESLRLNHKPWKQWMNVNPNPTANLISLYDLLFSDDFGVIDGELYPRFWYNSNKAYFNLTSGTKVGHDIIIYNQLILNTNGSVISTDDKFGLWEQYGLDIGLITYDRRSKPRKKVIKRSDIIKECSQNQADGSPALSSSAWSAFSSRMESIPEEITLYFYDKESAKYPLSSAEIYNNKIYETLSKIYRGNSAKAEQLAFEDFPNLFSIGTTDNSASLNADIILSAKDTVFNSAITFEDGKYAYTRVCLNPTSINVVRLVYAAVAAFIDSTDLRTNLANNIGYSAANGSINASNYRFLRTSGGDFAGEIDSLGNGILDLGKNATFREILKDVYVWLKAPFAADYVDPESFNQDLNQSADVVHRNLLLSSTGDFNRYADSTDNSDDTSASRPYIPKNTPLKDYISETFYNKTGSSETVGIMEKIIEDADKKDSLIGGVLSEPVSTENVAEFAEDTAMKVSPLNYFDPESRWETDDYRSLGSLPTIVPKYGNLVTDGRIMSPTIDELWYIIKKLISGHIKDIDVSRKNDNSINIVKSTDIQSELRGKDLSQPVTLAENKYKNDLDTRLNEISNVNFSFTDRWNENRIGDPLDFSISSSGTIKSGGIGAEAITVEEFITQPQEIQYKIYDIIETFASKIVNFNEKSDDKVLTKLKQDGTKEDIFVSRGKKIFGDRAIGTLAKDFIGIESEKTNLDVLRDKYEIKAGSTAYERSMASYKENYENNFTWGPRRQPMSLRELEAAIKGNKYNIVNNFAFIVSNFAITGGLSKEIIETSGGSSNIISGGGLYQFHRDYNFQPDNPNTYFRPNGDTTTNENTGGFDCQFNDLLSQNAIDETGITLLNGRQKESKMPILKANYGISDLVTDEIGGYTGTDVYLSAAGTWQYIGERVRIPILRSEY